MEGFKTVRPSMEVWERMKNKGNLKRNTEIMGISEEETKIRNEALDSRAL